MAISEFSFSLEEVKTYISSISPAKFFKNAEYKFFFEFITKHENKLAALEKFSIQDIIEIHQLFNVNGFYTYYNALIEGKLVKRKKERKIIPPQEYSSEYIYLNTTLEKAKKSFKLSKGQFNVLKYIYSNIHKRNRSSISLNQVIIAQNLNLKRQTVNRIIHFLKQEGYIDFLSQKLEGRSNIFYSTDKGKEFFKKCFCINTHHRKNDSFKTKFKNRRDVNSYIDKTSKNKKSDTILYNNFFNKKNHNNYNRKYVDKFFQNRFFDNLQKNNLFETENIFDVLVKDQNRYLKIKETTNLEERDIVFLAKRFRNHFTKNPNKLRFVRNLDNFMICFFNNTLANGWYKNN